MAQSESDRWREALANASRFGTAGPCSSWYAEQQHTAHCWRGDGKKYACSGYRPLDDGAVPTWDFNWPQPRPLRAV
jgi:hypothetical protein